MGETSTNSPAPAVRVSSWTVALRDAILLTVLSAGLALGFNALRPGGGIPLVASQAYEIMVPCPEFEGEAEALAPVDLPLGKRGLLLVDARQSEAHQDWHLPGAISVPYDFLEPTSPELIKKLLSRNPRQVVVYGDGDNPDTGEQLARELSGKGLRNVSYVKGGAPALRKRAGEGGTP